VRLPARGTLLERLALGEPVNVDTWGGTFPEAGPKIAAPIRRPATICGAAAGINPIRRLDGRLAIWGARTLAVDDPKWKYVNVRRLSLFIERSIDEGTRWAAFEPNGEPLWSTVRQAVDDFMAVLFRAGALTGTRQEDAYFVRCDRTTMTQDDLDNGRLVVLVGFAPVTPAEFVTVRIA
jgi:hypothetical protein